VACPVGFYCPAKTSTYESFPCPAGRYNDLTGKGKLSDCKICTAASYCELRGLAAVSGSCLDGYLCSAGSIFSTGLNYQTCPKNSYCDNGVQTSCAAGSYNAERGSWLSSDCIVCPPGKICPNLDVGIIDCP